MAEDRNKSPSERRAPRLSKQMVDAIIAYGDDRSPSNFDRLKELIVRLAQRSHSSRDAATPKQEKRKVRPRRA